MEFSFILSLWSDSGENHITHYSFTMSKTLIQQACIQSQSFSPNDLWPLFLWAERETGLSKGKG